jgi:hypothetical protein
LQKIESWAIPFGMNEEPQEPRPLTPEEREVGVNQYVTFVQWTEQLVDRRAEANRFFSGINTAMFGATGFLLFGKEFSANGHEFLLLVFPVAGFFLSTIWLSVLHSHRMILDKKFKAIHEMEKRLPLDPYTKEQKGWFEDAEAKQTGSAGFERKIPLLFQILHIGLLLYLVLFVVGPALPPELKQSVGESVPQAQDEARAPDPRSRGGED